MSRLHWIEIPGRLAIMARPRADDWLEADVTEWRTSGVDLVVSLLERDEVSELGLQREAELCRANGIEFISLPIPDRSVPDVRQALEIARSIADGIAGGTSCRNANHWPDRRLHGHESPQRDPNRYSAARRAAIYNGCDTGPDQGSVDAKYE